MDSARARRAASDESSCGLEFGGGVDFDGAKLGALAEGEFPGRGVLVAGLLGTAACGRKLVAPERAAPDGAELLGDGAVVEADPPPFAAARAAAAASAGLEAPRTGGVALFDGEGVATVWPDGAEKADPVRALLAAGRLLLDGDEGLDGGEGLDGTAAGRPPLPDADDPEDEGAEGAGAEGAGRPPDAFAFCGRDGTAAGRDAGAGREDPDPEDRARGPGGTRRFRPRGRPGRSRSGFCHSRRSSRRSLGTRRGRADTRDFFRSTVTLATGRNLR